MGTLFTTNANAIFNPVNIALVSGNTVKSNPGGSQYIWTGLYVSAANDCNDWTSNVGGTGQVGNNNSSLFMFQESNPGDTCNTLKHLICVEQP
ncbi:hypothetical protein [Leptospira meyeri]|uniref:hypothetical protein n=1 Tax=Leptospira meyeri TaxID=29508 RepID=UPI003CCFE1F9